MLGEATFYLTQIANQVAESQIYIPTTTIFCHTFALYSLKWPIMLKVSTLLNVKVRDRNNDVCVFPDLFFPRQPFLEILFLSIGTW